MRLTGHTSRGTVNYHVVDAVRDTTAVSDCVVMPNADSMKTYEEHVVDATKDEVCAALPMPSAGMQEATQDGADYTDMKTAPTGERQAEESGAWATKLISLFSNYSQSISQLPKLEQPTRPEPKRAKAKIVPAGDFVSI